MDVLQAARDLIKKGAVLADLVYPPSYHHDDHKDVIKHARTLNSDVIRFTRNSHRNLRESYAVLSHTWGADEDEVKFEDIVDGSAQRKKGYDKVRFCIDQAKKDNIKYSWVDTCCIDKRSGFELFSAINSMWDWYRDADKCYVFLSDVSSSIRGKSAQIEPTWNSFRSSRWFTRGWTLQELLAPKVVEFFSREGHYLGDKVALFQLIHEVTQLPVDLLIGRSAVHGFNLADRVLWAANRETTRAEDKAYCLFGIFDVHLPILYGEGEEKAMERLKRVTGVPPLDLDAALREGYNDAQLSIQGLPDKSSPLEDWSINLRTIRCSRPSGDKPVASVIYRTDPLGHIFEFRSYGRFQVEIPPESGQISLSTLFEYRKCTGNTYIRPNRILIRDQAGGGGKALCKKIVRDFYRHNLWKRLFDRVIWLSLKDLRETAGRDVVELLQERFHFTSIGEHLWSSLYRIAKDRRTLYLLDGLDEISSVLDTENHVRGLLLELLCHSSIIITSRPHATHVLDHQSLDLELELDIGRLASKMDEECVPRSTAEFEVTSYEVNELESFQVEEYYEEHGSNINLMGAPTQLTDEYFEDSGLGKSTSSIGSPDAELEQHRVLANFIADSVSTLHPDRIERLVSSQEDIGSRQASTYSKILQTAEKELSNCFLGSSQFQTVVKEICAELDAQAARDDLIEHLKYYFLDLRESASSRLEHACTGLLRNHWSRERIVGLFLGDVPKDDDEQENQQKGRPFVKSQQDLNTWIASNKAFAEDDSAVTDSFATNETSSIVASVQLPSHEEIDESSTEVFKQTPDYVGQMAEFLLCGKPFQRLLQKLCSQSVRLEYLWLRDTLILMPLDRVDINLDCEASTVDRAKHLLESISGVMWDWWPLRPPRIALRQGDCRIIWRCLCGLIHCIDAPKEDAYRLQRLLNARTSFDSSLHPCSEYICKSRSLNTYISSMKDTTQGILQNPSTQHIATVTPVIVKYLLLCFFLMTETSVFAGTLKDIGWQLALRVSFIAVFAFHDWLIGWKLLISANAFTLPAFTAVLDPGSDPSDSGSEASPNNSALIHNGGGKVLTQPAVGSDSIQSAGNAGSSINTEVGSNQDRDNHGSPLTSVLHLILGAKRSISHDIDFVNFKDPTLQTDDDFLQKLRIIQRKQWTTLNWLSVFQTYSMVFLQFLKEDEYFIGEGDASQPFPKGDKDYSYRDHEYDPPVTDLPPISEPLFACFLNRCSSQCTKKFLIPWHHCRKASQIKSPNVSRYPSIIDRVPKKRSAWDHEAPGREAVWGLRWKRRPSWPRVFIYSLGVLFGPLVFLICWEWKWPRDVQTATIPLLIGLGLLQIVWSSVWLANYLKRD